MKFETIKLKVVNGPTILKSIIKIVKRQNLTIYELVTTEYNPTAGASSVKCANISITLQADSDQSKLLKTQFKKQADIISVN